MEYALTRLAGVSCAVVPIGQDRFSAIRDARVGLLKCLSIEERFDFVIANYVEFEQALLDCSLEDMVVAVPSKTQFDEDRALFNRRLANLLTAAKGYVNQIPSEVSAIDGDLRRTVGAALRREYDDRIGFRGLSAIRNYTQHVDLPVPSAVYRSELIGRGADAQVAITVEPTLRPSRMQVDRKSNAKVLADLARLGPEVPLKPLVRDCIEGLWSVHRFTREQLEPHISEWEAVLAAAIAAYQVQSEDVESTLGLVAVEIDAEGKHAVELAIAPDVVSDHRRYLERRNGLLDGLSDRYVTSQSGDLGSGAGAARRG